jgi:two-component system, NarL family, nitrate/nitrite response regulator NarL
MALRALIVDDNLDFIESASRLLEREGMDVVAGVSTGAQAIEEAGRLQPEVILLDVDLGAESGFDLARRLAATDGAPNMIMISTHAAADIGDLVAVSPVLGFISKSTLSATAIRDLVDDRAHGHACRHEALVHSTSEELVAASLPFLRLGLASDEVVLVVTRETARENLREALGDDATGVEFADATDWYRTLEDALAGYRRYVRGQLERGAPRVRIVAEVIPSAATAGWSAYEASISVALAAEPVSFICAYDTRELPAHVLADAARTHPLLRSTVGTRPSPRYAEPSAFARAAF